MAGFMGEQVGDGNNGIGQDGKKVETAGEGRGEEVKGKGN